jgi:hypothetical protein
MACSWPTQPVRRRPQADRGALRRLIHDASRQLGCDPDTLSFTHTVRIVRRQLPFHAAFSPRPAPPHG